jgi:thiol-disulfide isomerase/thioredoxin
MPSLKERFSTWKKKRSLLQKIGDILFLTLIIVILIPGPRRVIKTNVNRVLLHIKTPKAISEEEQEQLSDMDYNWVLAWGQNEPFYFSNLRDKVVIVNFWATWCPICVAEMPELQSLYRKYGDRVAFVMVTSEKQEVVEAFMEKNQYLMPVFYMAMEPPEIFAFNGYPTTFIISSDGRVVSRETGALNWDSRATHKILDELLK